MRIPQKDSRWLHMDASDSVTGPSTTLSVAEGGATQENRGGMTKEKGRGYELRSLRWITSYLASGAGWAYVISWVLTRASVPRAEAGIQTFGSPQDVIFHHMIRDSDSYGQRAHVERTAEAVTNFFAWEKDVRPIVLVDPRFFCGLYQVADGTPSRAWSASVNLTIEYVPVDLSAKDWEHLGRAYGLRGV